MRIAPSTDCSASRLWGGRRSITGTPRLLAGCVTFSVTAAIVCPLGCYPQTPSTNWRAHADGCEKPVDSRPLVQPPNHADELALNSNVVVEHRRVVRVRRLQSDAVLLLEESLERDRVLLDLGDDDVAVPGSVLRPDEDEVAVGDVGLDHRVAAD